MRRLSLLALTLACGTQLSEPVRNEGYAAVMITPQIDTLDAVGDNRLLSVAMYDAERPEGHVHHRHFAARPLAGRESHGHDARAADDARALRDGV